MAHGKAMQQLLQKLTMTSGRGKVRKEIAMQIWNLRHIETSASKCMGDLLTTMVARNATRE